MAELATDKTGTTQLTYDVFVIGGGVNGAAIARDAAGRGLSVALAEMNDLASGTSSASTKLFHGGLRYLEFLEFSLVRHSLIERETLYRNMPHIAWPMRFVMPLDGNMRFESSSPVSRVLETVMPWLQGHRPDWIIRMGLFLYDNIGGRKILPATRSLDLQQEPEGAFLHNRFHRAYEYSDVWVQDARLVVLLAKDAEKRGADIMTYTKVIALDRFDDHWKITCKTDLGQQVYSAKSLVNAAGIWVERLLQNNMNITSDTSVRLVRGSHIVTKKLYDHDKCYFFQGEDGRIIFAIPYEDDYTLIGTTEAPHEDIDMQAVCSEEEINYLCAFASKYFAKAVTPDQVQWHFSGVRALFDDGSSSNTATSRDYLLEYNDDQAPLLSVFGGKITTHRKLAEDALAKMSYDKNSASWTGDAPLSGGAFDYRETDKLVQAYQGQYSFSDPKWLGQLFKRHGVNIPDILQDACAYSDLGIDFGGGLYQAEVDYFVSAEFARTADDILWRRSKFGLKLDEAQKTVLQDYLKGA